MQPVLNEVAAGVFHVQASDTNFVLLRDGAHVALVDGGYPRDRALVAAAVEQAGASPADLAALVVTHAHVDHIGAARWLHREHGVAIRCLDAEVPHARGEVHEAISTPTILAHAWRPSVLVFGLRAIASGGLMSVAPDDVEAFGPGEPLDLPGRPVPIHTPGHTSGHTAFHLPEAGALVTGDALVTVDLWDHGRTGPQLMRPQFTHDQAAAELSLQRLAEVEADVLVPGHGAPWFGSPADAVEIARGR